MARVAHRQALLSEDHRVVPHGVERVDLVRVRARVRAFRVRVCRVRVRVRVWVRV